MFCDNSWPKSSSDWTFWVNWSFQWADFFIGVRVVATSTFLPKVASVKYYLSIVHVKSRAWHFWFSGSLLAPKWVCLSNPTKMLGHWVNPLCQLLSWNIVFLNFQVWTPSPLISCNQYTIMRYPVISGGRCSHFSPTPSLSVRRACTPTSSLCFLWTLSPSSVGLC